MPRPSHPAKLSFAGWIFLLCIVTALVSAIYSSTEARWAVAILSLWIFGATIFTHRHFKRLKAERMEESICTFARSLPARVHDTWVVRAVYDELSRSTKLPLRPGDHLSNDLKIDSEDLDDISFEIARRAGRSMKETKSNPLFGRVTTVADAVEFMEKQPKEVSP